MRKAGCALAGALVAGALGIGVSGCGPAMVMHADGPTPAPGRIVAFPPFVTSFVLDADGAVTERDEEAGKAKTVLAASINYRISTNGGRYYGDASMRDVEGLSAFRQWSRRVLRVALFDLGEIGDSRPSVKDHPFDDDTSDISKRYQADAVLISLFLDGHNSSGRQALNGLAYGFGGMVVSARQQGVACLVRLDDGEMAWCRVAELRGAKLGERQQAQKVVDRLLSDMPGAVGQQHAPTPASETIPR